MEDYYPAELNAIVRAWNIMQGGKPSDEVDDGQQVVHMDPAQFFGDGGEML